MHGMRNMSSMGLLWIRQWFSQIHKRCDIHSNSAWHSLLFCETWRSHTGVDEDYGLSTGEELGTFRWNVVPLPNRLEINSELWNYVIFTPQSCMEFLTILGTTALMASTSRHTGQIQSLHQQNMAPWPKTGFDISQILFATFYFIFWG